MTAARRAIALARIIRALTKAVLPLYRKLAGDKNFAVHWARAVQAGDLTAMERLHKRVTAPGNGTSLSTNAIGFFVSIDAPRPIYQYTNATFLVPGKVRFHFPASVAQEIARAVLPLYARIVKDPVFTIRIARAILRNEPRALRSLVRCQVASPFLLSVTIDAFGFDIAFRSSADGLLYHNAFFRDIPAGDLYPT
ncbi:hypothetical protein BSNK01_18010 [Bacillaceae bacterium]